MNTKQLMRLKKSRLMQKLNAITNEHSLKNNPTKEEISKSIIAHTIVKDFNEKNPKSIQWRPHTLKPFEEVKARSKAFVPKHHTEPAVFFKGIGGYCIISPKFCKY